MAYRASAAPARMPQRATEPSIRALPGYRGQDGQAQSVKLMGAMIIAVLVFIAIVGCTRVFLNSNTVSANVTANELSERISVAKDLGSQLELEQTVLANPSRVRPYAESTLGMTTVGSYSYMTIEGSSVAVDSDGDLSLSGTLDLINSGGQSAESAQAAAE